MWIFKPKYWMLGTEYSSRVDELFIKALEDDVEPVVHHTGTFLHLKGRMFVLGSSTPEIFNLGLKRPSRSTIYEFRKRWGIE